MDTTMLPNQPLNYSQLIKRSLAIYKDSFKRVIILALILSIIAFIPRLLSGVIGQDLFLGLSPFSPHRLWLLLVDLASLLFFIAILWRIYCVIRNVHEPLAEDFRKGSKKLFYVFFAGILQMLIVSGIAFIIIGIQLILHDYDLLFANTIPSLIITCIVFVGQFFLILYVSTLFIFFIPLIAIENQGILAALNKSISLVWNHWWRTFSVQMTPWICYVLFLFLLKFAFNINIHIYFIEVGTSHPLWTTCLHIIIFALFIPWVAALLLTQLKDLELRKTLADKK